MCKQIREVPGLLNGYVCCGPKCHTYNSDERRKCKFCQQDRCASSIGPTTTVIYRKNDKVVVQEINTPKKEGSN